MGPSSKGQLIRVIPKKVLNSFTCDEANNPNKTINFTYAFSEDEKDDIIGRRLHLNDIYVRRPKRLDESSMALLGLHECLYKEKSCAPRLNLIKRIPTRKRSSKIRVLMRIFPTRKDPLCQEMDVNSTLL